MAYLLPSFNNVCSIIQREETRRLVMQGNANPKTVKTVENAAFVARSEQQQISSQNRMGFENRFTSGRLFCNYCKKQGHSKEWCWHLHRRPTRGRGQARGTRLKRTEETCNAETRKEDEIAEIARLLKQITCSNLVVSSKPVTDKGASLRRRQCSSTVGI